MAKKKAEQHQPSNHPLMGEEPLRDGRDTGGAENGHRRSSTMEQANAILREQRADNNGQMTMGIWETGTSGRLGFVMRGLKVKRKGRHIADGYQYVGGFPADMWRLATSDLRYKTLSHGINTFPERWRTLQQQMDQPLHYISIGPGTGEKDNRILTHLQQLAASEGRSIVYMPVDISSDLLKVSFEKSMVEIDEDVVDLLPMELDITEEEAIETLRALRPAFPGGGGVLVSLLGNTLANFRDDNGMLTRIGGLLSDPEDVLLLEVATTPEATKDLAEVAEEEYEGSLAFRNFVMAALSQYTDCISSSGSVVYEAAVRSGKIEVSALFAPEKDRVIHLTDGDHFDLKINETIRLYKSRKYTDDGLATLLRGIEEIDESRTSYGDSAGFGVVTKLLRRDPTADRSRRW